MNCRDVSVRISSGALDDAPWRTRAVTRLHLLYCRHCRRFAKQIDALGAICRGDLSSVPEPDRIRSLEDRILGEAFGTAGTQSDPEP